MLRYHPSAQQALSLPGNFTLVHIKAPLWHEPHAPLRLFAAEGVEVVNIGGFIRDLKVANAAVTLQETEEGSLQRPEQPVLPRPTARSLPGQAATTLIQQPFLPGTLTQIKAQFTALFIQAKTSIAYQQNITESQAMGF